MRREEEIGLVRKAKGGDTAAFAVMIRRYKNLVYATAFQILKDPALAEDVAQEAFVTACGSLLLSILVPQKPANRKFASRMERGRRGIPGAPCVSGGRVYYIIPPLPMCGGSMGQSTGSWRCPPAPCP